MATGSDFETKSDVTLSRRKVTEAKIEVLPLVLKLPEREKI